MILDDVIAKISEQQKGQSAHVQQLGEQLKDICKSYPPAAELVLQDLNNPDMSIVKCEKNLAVAARKNSGAIDPVKSTLVISDFYGLNIKQEDISFEMRIHKEAKPIVISLVDLM